MFQLAKLLDLIGAPTVARTVQPSAPPPPAPFTLPHLAAWIDGHDPAESYYWESSYTCLLGRYATAQNTGVADLTPYSSAVHLLEHGSVRSGEIADTVARMAPHTFGAAAERLKFYMGRA